MKGLNFACVLCLVLFCCIAPSRAVAQTSNSPESAQGDRDRTLQQLLNEVRELRLAVQRATVNNTRFQMLIERVRIEQARVDAIGRQLENIRAQAADMRASRPQMEQQIKDAEALLDRTSDPNAHADMESRIKAMKSTLVRLAQEEERLQSREATLNTDLQAAQSKVNELNSQLDALMNELKGP